MLDTNKLINQTLMRLELTHATVVSAIISTEWVGFERAVIERAVANKPWPTPEVPTEVTVVTLHPLTLSWSSRKHHQIRS